MPDNKREEVKNKIDKAIASKSEPEQEETPEEENDKPSIWTPFARKIYADIKLYIAKLGDAHPTRAVATKFHNDIEDKLEKGKEQDNMIKYYNKVFKLPGVSTVAWNYFAESVIDPKAKEKGEDALIKGIVRILRNNTIIEEGKQNIIAKEILEFIKNFDKKESVLSDGVNESKMTPRQKWDEFNYWKRNAFVRKYFSSLPMETRNRIADKSYSEIEAKKLKEILDIINANVLTFKI